jgi:hypothetical protein
MAGSAACRDAQQAGTNTKDADIGSRENRGRLGRKLNAEKLALYNTGGMNDETQSHERFCRRSREGPEVLHRRPGLRQENGFLEWAIQMAHRGLA